jgi:hypothetical protein
LRAAAVVLLLALLAAPSSALAAAEESADEAVCRMIGNAAARHALPVTFFTRLIWRESSFRSHVVSSAGAQGIAQFMPGTADERGLLDPFDPEEAIPASAHLLSDLRKRFGNLGLAAAAYNGGPRRVERWLQGDTVLPLETEDYVAFVTGRAAADWQADLTEPGLTRNPYEIAEKPCLQQVAGIRIEVPRSELAEGPFAPWGVQLSGNFSKSRALASFDRVRVRYASVLGDVRPMVVGTRLRNRGARRFYRVRAPAETRKEAEALCAKLRRAGGACIVLKSAR